LGKGLLTNEDPLQQSWEKNKKYVIYPFYFPDISGSNRDYWSVLTGPDLPGNFFPPGAPGNPETDLHFKNHSFLTLIKESDIILRFISLTSTRPIIKKGSVWERF